MRGAVAFVALLVCAACQPAEVDPIGEAHPPGVVDADGGRTFVDRQTFERFCPVRSAVASDHLGSSFAPVSVYLAPADPDGAAPSEWDRNLAVCRYEARSVVRSVLIVAYDRQENAEQAHGLSEHNRSSSSMALVNINAARDGDLGFLTFEDRADADWLTLEFVRRDVIVNYILIGAVRDKDGALVDLPRPAPPLL